MLCRICIVQIMTQPRKHALFNRSMHITRLPLGDVELDHTDQEYIHPALQI